MHPKDSEQDEKFIPVISFVLERLVRQNDRLQCSNSTIFHAINPPSITIRAYIERIVRYAKCSKDFFILGLIYIDRLIQRNPTYVLNSLNVHRLLITSVMLASKYSNDFFYNNSYYAKVGGVPVKELNSLEIEFLYLLNFNLYVSTDVFDRYQSELSRHCLNSVSQQMHHEAGFQPMQYWTSGPASTNTTVAHLQQAHSSNSSQSHPSNGHFNHSTMRYIHPSSGSYSSYNQVIC